MDAFEHVVSLMLQERGYWTRIGYKVELPKDVKKRLGNPSMPRVEVDVLAFSPIRKEVLVVECKSYLDSPGVTADDFDFRDEDKGGKYKLFNKARLREAVLKQLVTQLAKEELCAEQASVHLCLAAGKIRRGNEDRLSILFRENGWRLYGPIDVAQAVRKLADKGYDNDVATVVAKILERSRS
jgi:hypothetical protein